MATKQDKPARRICRTFEECFEAGREDGRRLDRPLSPAEARIFADLLRPYLIPAATDRKAAS
jgi:hypothetical protein